MNYHTDLRPSYEGCKCACPAQSCVISVSVGATMNFWYREIINGDVSNLGEQRAVLRQASRRSVRWQPSLLQEA